MERSAGEAETGVRRTGWTTEKELDELLFDTIFPADISRVERSRAGGVRSGRNAESHGSGQ